MPPPPDSGRPDAQFAYSMELPRLGSEYRVMERVVDKGPATQAAATGALGRRLSDRDAFTALFEQEALAVLRYARSRVGSAHADDIAAEVFAEAWKHRARFDPARGSSRAWLLGIATNIIARERDIERRWLRGRALASDLALDRSNPLGSSAETTVVESETIATEHRRLIRALERLPARMRDPFLLHELSDLTYEDIAVALSIPIGTVRSRINRARRRLEGVRS